MRLLLIFTENIEYYKIPPTDTQHTLKKWENQFRIDPQEVKFRTSMSSLTNNLQVYDLYKIWNFHVKYMRWSIWNSGVSTWYEKTASENWRQTEGINLHRTDSLLNPVCQTEITPLQEGSCNHHCAVCIKCLICILKPFLLKPTNKPHPTRMSWGLGYSSG